MKINIDKRKIYTKELAYFIGSLLGDGCLYEGKSSYQVSIVSEDFDFCEKCFLIIYNLFNKKGTVRETRKGDKISYYSFRVCSKDIFYFLREITENKSKIPKFIYRSKEFKKSFCQGLMDSDGWISKVNASDGYIRYRVGFKNISCWTNKFKDILDDLSIRTGKMGKQSNIRSVIKAFTFTINTFDYCSKVGFRINRKIKIQKEYLNILKKVG